jgi:predicted nucleic acid-binding protein
MIVLDTNVLSEALRPVPEPSVLDWLADQPSASLFTTAVTRGEILYGIRLLADGKRRKGLWDAADMYADIAASRRIAGKPISQFDAMIAAMARSRGAILATRNVKNFESCGIEVVNPWTA